MRQPPHFEPRYIDYAIDNLRVRQSTSKKIDAGEDVIESLASRHSGHSVMEPRNGRVAHVTPSDFRIEIEEGIEALFELGLDLFARALEHVHGDVRLVAVGELEGGVVDFVQPRPRAGGAFRRQESDLPCGTSYTG